MSLTSVWFLLFAAGLTVVYFLVPKKRQWWVLLAFSIAFYLLGGLKTAAYILVTATSVHFAALLLQKIQDGQKAYFKTQKPVKEEKARIKAQNLRKRRLVLIVTLVLNFGLLCVFKYANFAIEQLNALLGIFGSSKTVGAVSLIIPLGISFYTFQSSGYLVDVYWGNVTAERNYAKTLLFVSFFPQITQGPISSFSQLSGELFTPHEFDFDRYVRGGSRMIWGFAKKIALADMLAPYVQSVFQNYPQYTGLTVLLGAFFYSIQIYADFSGYMDIVCGLCQILGIRLTENFERPYFSKSVAEYWRRWHISLGAWFKSYIYYPIAVSGWNRRLGKRAQKLGKHFGQTLPATVALVVVWLTTGLWHGASWSYVVWGGLNGLFIILSLWLEPVFDRAKTALHIREDAWLWRAFQTVRTFVLITFIKVLPEVGSLRDGLGLWKRIFTEHTLPRSLSELLPFAAKGTLVAIVIGTALLFVTDLISRRQPLGDWFAKKPAALRFFVLLALVMVTLYFVGAGVSGGFMYAQF